MCCGKCGGIEQSSPSESVTQSAVHYAPPRKITHYNKSDAWEDGFSEFLQPFSQFATLAARVLEMTTASRMNIMTSKLMTNRNKSVLEMQCLFQGVFY